MPHDDIETEYKFKVEDKDLISAKLDELAERKKDREYQANVMFDNQDELMQTTDGRVRVRTLGNSGDKVLTYKKPLSPDNGAKRETEYEIKFKDDSGIIEKILERLEFYPTTSYERYQTKWSLGNTEITLDEYPFANFIEIEGSANEIYEVVSRLGFDAGEALIKPCDTLFTEWRKERGLPIKPHMRFEDYDK